MTDAEPEGPTVGEWTERPLMASRDALGLTEKAPDPVTVWELHTEDGQLLRAAVFGEGRKGAPWLLQLAMWKLAPEELIPGQSLGPARFPTVPEIIRAVSLLPHGVLAVVPPFASGMEVPQITRFTTLQVQQTGAIKDTEAARAWDGLVVVPNLRTEPGGA